MNLDLHVHSKYSYDNISEPEEIIEFALRKNLDGILITEHHSYEASEPWEEWIRDKKKNKGLLIFRAVEVSTSCGHVIVIGFTNDAWNDNCYQNNPYHEIESILTKVHEVNGVSILAHPCRENVSYPILDDFEKWSRFTAVEGINAANSAEENRRAIRILETREMSYTGGSDAHAARNVGNAYTRFEEKIETLENLMNQLRSGRYSAHAYHQKYV